MAFADRMGAHEYLRFIQYQKHIIKSIRVILRKHNIAEFDAFPHEYEGLARLHEDLLMLQRCPYALAHWRHECAVAAEAASAS